MDNNCSSNVLGFLLWGRISCIANLNSCILSVLVHSSFINLSFVWSVTFKFWSWVCSPLSSRPFTHRFDFPSRCIENHFPCQCCCLDNCLVSSVWLVDNNCSSNVLAFWLCDLISSIANLNSCILSVLVHSSFINLSRVWSVTFKFWSWVCFPLSRIPFTHRFDFPSSCIKNHFPCQCCCLDNFLVTFVWRVDNNCSSNVLGFLFSIIDINLATILNYSPISISMTVSDSVYPRLSQVDLINRSSRSSPWSLVFITNIHVRLWQLC